MFLVAMLVQGKMSYKIAGFIHFQPKMFKNKLEIKFQNAIDDILKQNEILAGIKTTDCELISSSTTVSTTTPPISSDSSEIENSSQKSAKSEDSSDDESKINDLVEEFHQTTISSASTLPFCDCKLKMHLKTDNFAICRKKLNPCSKVVNVQYYPTIAKYE